MTQRFMKASFCFDASDGGAVPDDGSLSVSDGETTVENVTSLTLTGATVTNEGAGEARVAISGAGGNLIISAPLALSSDDINNMFTTPLTLVPAPGAGKELYPIGVIFSVNAGAVSTGSRNGNAGNVSVFFSGDEFIVDFNLFKDLRTFVNATDATFYGRPQNASIFSQPTAPNGNQALMLSNTGWDYGDYGAILTSSVGDGGSGYSPGNTGTIDPNANGTDNPRGASNGNATYTVFTVDGGGAVLTYSINNHGSGYCVADGYDTDTNGNGTGFTINVNSIAPGNSTGSVSAIYAVRDLP